MAHLWLPQPRQFPNKCFMTGVSDREHGPYLEVDGAKPYIDPITRREGRQYWSFSAWRTTVVDPNGPYKDILEEEVQRRTEELTERIRHLERELASDPMRIAVSKIQQRVDSELSRKAKSNPSGKPSEGGIERSGKPLEELKSRK